MVVDYSFLHTLLNKYRWHFHGRIYHLKIRNTKLFVAKSPSSIPWLMSYSLLSWSGIETISTKRVFQPIFFFPCQGSSKINIWLIAYERVILSLTSFGWPFCCFIKRAQIEYKTRRREPRSYGRRLMFWSSWVQIPTTHIYRIDIFSH